MARMCPTRVLAEGFNFRGRRPVLEPSVRHLPRRERAARAGCAVVNSSLQTGPYQDEDTGRRPLRYQGDRSDNHFNRGFAKRTPSTYRLVYFVGTRPNWYRPDIRLSSRTTTRVSGRCSSPLERCAARLTNGSRCTFGDPIERRYIVRRVKQRIHQAQFRGAVLPAYLIDARSAAQRDPPARRGTHHRRRRGTGRAACQQRRQPLLDPPPRIRRGSCRRSADYNVHVSRRLLDDEDGPMLELLKRFHGGEIVVPRRRAWQPKRERLALRFERFLASSG